MFWVVCNIGTETIYCVLKVAIRTLNYIPFVHEWLQRLVDDSKRSVEESVTEDLKSFIIGVFLCSYQLMRLSVLGKMEHLPLGMGRKPIKMRVSL